jgi:disulfide bond formation protein DsbB
VAARSALVRANWLALAAPAALLGGAYVGQYAFHLYPCEMCWWQRYPHFAALVLAVLAMLLPQRRLLVTMAAIAILVSGLLGAYHAGVEWHWWEGLTTCSSTAAAGGNPLDAIMNAPIIRCDQAQWRLLGISLAGWNFAISTAAALAIFALLGRRGRPAA